MCSVRASMRDADAVQVSLLAQGGVAIQPTQSPHLALSVRQEKSYTQAYAMQDCFGIFAVVSHEWRRHSSAQKSQMGVRVSPQAPLSRRASQLFDVYHQSNHERALGLVVVPDYRAAEPPRWPRRTRYSGKLGNLTDQINRLSKTPNEKADAAKPSFSRARARAFSPAATSSAASREDGHEGGARTRRRPVRC